MNQKQGWYYAIIEWFARNAVAANLLMMILLLGGLYSVFTIKKESQPPIETNFITVTMPFLGSSPEDVEEGILIKIEEARTGFCSAPRTRIPYSVSIPQTLGVAT